MKLKEFKEWLNKLPEVADKFEIVLGELKKKDEEYYFRLDEPISALDLDMDNKEVLIMRMNNDELINTKPTNHEPKGWGLGVKSIQEIFLIV